MELEGEEAAEFWALVGRQLSCCLLVRGLSDQASDRPPSGSLIPGLTVLSCWLFPAPRGGEGRWQFGSRVAFRAGGVRSSLPLGPLGLALLFTCGVCLHLPAPPPPPPQWSRNEGFL